MVYENDLLPMASPGLNVAYLLSFTKFQMKKDTKDTAKETIPKVSSLGQGAKWVNWIVRVSGCTKATATIYNHPSRPKINKVKDAAWTIFIIMIFYIILFEKTTIIQILFLMYNYKIILGI